MLDINKPIQTRDGRKARIICTDRAGEDEDTIVALIGKDEDPYTYRSDGSYSENCQPADLINVPEKHVRYVWMFKSGTELIKNSPVKKPYLDVVSCKRVELQKGQFDE